MFGFNTVSIDIKGRISIPAKYRQDLINADEKRVIVTKDPQYPALKVYPDSIWQDISNKLQSLQALDPIVRKLQWTILGNASVNNFTPAGRMLFSVPSDLRKHAEIEDESKIAIVGMGNKFELWSLDNWNARQTDGALSTEILEIV